MRKKIAICLSMIMILGITMQANAASNNVGSLYDCIISVSCASNGVRVSYSEEATEKADEIGCKDIILWEKNGSSWTQIPMNGSFSTNSDTNGGSGVYTAAKKGKTYKASCTHYAKYGSTTKTLDSETGEMVYN